MIPSHMHNTPCTLDDQPGLYTNLTYCMQMEELMDTKQNNSMFINIVEDF